MAAAAGAAQPFPERPVAAEHNRSPFRPTARSRSRWISPRFDGRQIVNFPYKANGTGFGVSDAAPGGAGAGAAAVWRRPRQSAYQLFTEKKGETHRVQLTRTAYSHNDVVVSPDGKWIAFTADAHLRPDSLVRDRRFDREAALRPRARGRSAQ